MIVDDEFLDLAQAHVEASQRLLEATPSIDDPEAREAALHMLKVSAKVFGRVFNDEALRLRQEREAEARRASPPVRSDP